MADLIEAIVLISLIFLLGAALGAVAAALFARRRDGPGSQ